MDVTYNIILLLTAYYDQKACNDGSEHDCFGHLNYVAKGE